MDTEQLIIDVKARFAHNASKAYLKDKYESKLIFADQNGMWTANAELFAVLSVLIIEPVIILDNYGNPVKVNRNQLLLKAQQVYRSVMEEWYDETESLKNNR
jgi:hypothetical protein